MTMMVLSQMFAAGSSSSFPLNSLPAEVHKIKLQLARNSSLSL